MGNDQMTEQIDRALEAVNASNATEEYKFAAFKVVLRELLGQGSSAAVPHSMPVAFPQAEANGEEWQLRIANTLKLTVEQVAAIYHKESEESLRLILDTSILSKNKQTATLDIARLLSAGRVAGGFDEVSTSTDIIRAEAEYYGRLDTKNFTRALHSLKPNFHYDSKEKVLAPRAPGFTEAADVVKKYSGSEK